MPVKDEILVDETLIDFTMINKQVETYTIKLFLSGPIELAKQIIRQECLQKGLCVTIEPTLYIYTGGEELGYVVGLLNYPRFPTEQEELKKRAKDLLYKLLEGTYQLSGLLVTPQETMWISKRKEQV